MWRPRRNWWLHHGYLYVAAGIFIVALIVSLAKTLQWGKEAEEYATLLEEEKADGLKRRSDDE